MLDDVYNERILDLAGNIPRLGRLASPDATAKAHSRLCGSTVTVDLKMADGRVADFAHEVRACALGQASSSIMARTVVGSTPDELRGVREVMRLHEDALAALADLEARYRRLVELNAAEQAYALRGTPIVEAAWARGQRLTIHAMVYDLAEGVLRDLGVSYGEAGEMPDAHVSAWMEMFEARDGP